MAADNTEKDKKDNSFMMKLATLIVDKRKGFYLIFIVLCIFCVLSMNKVKVNNDLTTYLPDTTETRRGLDLMDSEFTTYGSARILICNVTFDEAQKLADQVEKMDGVSMLDFDDTEDHYHDMEALLSVTFDEEADTEATQQHLTEVLDALSDYDVYYSGAKYLSYLLTPATVCLAVPLYEKLELLKNNWKAIFAGITAGVLASLCCILVMSLICGLSHEEYVTFLPKSITTAIGMGISEELGGYVTLTVAVIIITGVLGNMFAPAICRIFRIQEPIAKGIAIGTASHAVGTAKAIEMGEVEGAMSSLSIAVAGVLTVGGSVLFSNFL